MIFERAAASLQTAAIKPIIVVVSILRIRHHQWQSLESTYATILRLKIERSGCLHPEIVYQTQDGFGAAT